MGSQSQTRLSVFHIVTRKLFFLSTKIFYQSRKSVMILQGVPSSNTTLLSTSCVLEQKL